MSLRISTLVLKTNQQVTESASKLRGFFATRYPEHTLLHHHSGNERFVYSYPKVQYKILDGSAVVVGIREGAEVLPEIYQETDYLHLNGKTYKVLERRIIEKEAEFGRVQCSKQYRFLTPWLALNQKNHKRYVSLKGRERTQLLDKILIGNILSMAKALEYVITSELRVRTELKTIVTAQKGIPMVGFEGGFQVNFEIPHFLGLGKSVSRGFGTVIKARNREHGEIPTSAY